MMTGPNGGGMNCTLQGACHDEGKREGEESEREVLFCQQNGWRVFFALALCCAAAAAAAKRARARAWRQKFQPPIVALREHTTGGRRPVRAGKNVTHCMYWLSSHGKGSWWYAEGRTAWPREDRLASRLGARCGRQAAV